jgi:hypothetical protein
VESLAPVRLLHYETGMDLRHSEAITPGLLERCRERHPQVTLRDLTVSQVTLILQKLPDGK